MKTPSLFEQTAGRARRYLAALFATVMATALLQGCNLPNSGTSAAAGDSDGGIVISLTDAPGDFLAYTVNVSSLTLTKANGSVVTTMAEPTPIDFSQYTDMTEFLTAATVPGGIYTHATMTLDYTDADIQVEDADGNAVKVDQILDADGNPVTTLEVSVRLEGRNALRIAPGVPAHLTLDFDLNASNTVSFAEDGTPSMAVEPFLVADLNPAAPKPHRLRGLLKSVDTDNSTFDVTLRPFRHDLNDHRARFGGLTVTTTDETSFDIDGTTYAGADGLAQLALAPALTAVAVVGELKFNPVRFEAREVHAGDSVPGGSLDAVTGNVTARSGTTLTVQGATLIRAGGSVVFNDSVTVNIGETTAVSGQGKHDGDWSTNDISVGQRITVFGTVSGTAPDLALDATSGRAHLMMTTVGGTVVSVADGSLMLNLQGIDRRDIGLFSFGGTGDAAENDADPQNYEIATGALNLSGLNAGDAVHVAGFVTPFGSAPADFTATSVVNVTAVHAQLAVGWRPATAQPFSATGSDAATLDLTDSVVHHLRRGRLVTDLTGLATAPVLQPADNSVFLIKNGRTVTMHTTFDAFINDVNDRLAAGAKMGPLNADGSFDDATATLSAHRIAVGIR